MATTKSIVLPAIPAGMRRALITEATVLRVTKTKAGDHV